MPVNRFYLPQPFEKSKTLLLKESEHYHLKNVMRNKAGDHVELINGQDQLATAHIDHVDRHETALSIDSIITKKSPYPLFHLVMGLSAPAKLEMAVEKCTELGCSHFTIIPMERSKKKHLSNKDLTRIEHIIISATKQCGRLDLPTLDVVDSLESFQVPSSIDKVLIGDLQADETPLLKKAENRLFFIGPESGFSDQEIALIKEKHKARGTLLHHNTLRFETACITATVNALTLK